MRSIVALLFLVGLLSASGFAPQPSVKTVSTTALEMKNSHVASLFAAAVLASGVATTAPAFASPPALDSAQIVVAGRSGGRMGGRSMGGGMGRSMGRSSYGYSPRSTYRSSTTIVRPMIAPPVMVSPFGYGYSPFGGFGTFDNSFDGCMICTGN